MSSSHRTIQWCFFEASFMQMLVPQTPKNGAGLKSGGVGASSNSQWTKWKRCGKRIANYEWLRRCWAFSRWFYNLPRFSSQMVARAAFQITEEFQSSLQFYVALFSRTNAAWYLPSAWKIFSPKTFTLNPVRHPTIRPHFGQDGVRCWRCGGATRLEYHDRYGPRMVHGMQRDFFVMGVSLECMNWSGCKKPVIHPKTGKNVTKKYTCSTLNAHFM